MAPQPGGRYLSLVADLILGLHHQQKNERVSEDNLLTFFVDIIVVFLFILRCPLISLQLSSALSI